MTRIDRITLQGFKSFADRVSIPFPHGFTVICGPNGAGKSNISDAILFALGMSSAKQIRAERLVNLIFHGTKKRGSAKYCLVSLYIDNRDKKLPFDEEIKITRKVNDKGLTIFRLNGKVVTRSKIMDVLSSISLSAYGYNIIMQGDINRIIEMSGTGRREIIDQISGIQEFDDKKRKTQIELEKVEKHIHEMEIIENEKEKLLEKLKREKENAERRIVLDKEADKIRASIVSQEKFKIEQNLDDVNKQFDEYSKDLEELNKNYTEKAGELETKRKKVLDMGDTLLKKSRDRDLLMRINYLNNEIQRKIDRIEVNQAEISRTQIDFVAKAVIDEKGVIGTFSQIVEIPEKYSVAVKIASGRHMNDIVVETTDVALDCIDILKKKKIGRARFIPLDKIRAKKIELREKEKTMKHVIDYAVNLIKYEQKYASAVNYVLGNVLIAESLQEARNVNENAKISTLEGDVIEPAGAILGGFHKEGSREIILLKENEKMRQEIEALNEELDGLREKEHKENENIDVMQGQRVEIEKEVDKLKVDLEKIYDKRMAVQEKINRINIEKARRDAEIGNLKMEMEKYKEVTDMYDETPDKLRNMLRHVQNEIDKLGAINMKATEEYDIISVEFEELRKRLERLTGERDAIVNTMAEIGKRRYEKFMETLSAIAANFKKIYLDLMNGDGNLRLEEDGNMDSGLIIEATTGAKKILNIDAMSGGEKTLTALGFLFAIQQYHASPFYILDEIDAALDKVNAQKIADFIKKYSGETQFIVVSHNDLTIKTADNVFGVSMEDGVSKVFSIRMPGVDEEKHKEVKEKLEEDIEEEIEEDWEKAEKIPHSFITDKNENNESS